MMMKTKMKETSLEAYRSILPDLQPKERSVIHAINRLQPCSNQDIAEYLLWPINCVTGRTNRLVEKGHVVAHDKSKNRFNRLVIRWKLK